ncbi:MAG TPA: amidohydrolase family protein [Deltaproteobacteria bacterium]|nr:amidohydrolase family protein [Deltaproteobacteria bacterium]
MPIKYDLILKNGRVIDPVNEKDGMLDVAIADGRIADIAEDIDPTLAGECFEVKDKYVIPGIIDPHVHASAWIGGRFAHNMLARAGVTTALDMSGPVAGVLETARDYGAGLNIACIQYVRPGDTVKGPDPDKAELNTLLETSLQQGAIGLKLLGGHFPLTPEATARTVEVAAHCGAYIAFHAGTQTSKSDLEGFKHAVELAQGHPLHIAHINSYCRGLIKPYMVETEEAIETLEAHPNIRSESYLSPLNGTSANCTDGVPDSNITKTILENGGFSATDQGMEEAVLAGYAQINMEAGGQVVLATGQSAVDYWRKRGTDTTVSFNANPPEPRIRLVTAKRKSGAFVVDSISTDGGGIPRNVIVSMGLSLVKLQALSIREFVIKTSRNPARMMGLSNKGHLSIGADADITVLDFEKQRPVMAISNGRVIMYKGYVCGKGVRFITTPAGKASVEAAGVEPLVINPETTPFLRRS